VAKCNDRGIRGFTSPGADHTVNELGGKWGGLVRYIFRRISSINAENCDGGKVAQLNGSRIL
jgi:hypothetical protein